MLWKMIFMVFFIIILNVFWECDTKSIPCVQVPKCRCDLSDGQATCTNENRNVTFIPSFPFEIKILKFTKKNILFVSSETFANVSNITALYLRDNNIKVISSDAFSKLHHLERLSLCNNHLLTPTNVAEALVSLQHGNLKSLWFEGMKWSTLPSNMFSNVRNITKLSLKANSFSSLDFNVFHKLENLQTLILKRNVLQSLTLSYFPSLKFLDVETNRLIETPKFCNGTQSLVPELEELFLSKNRLSIETSSFNCLQSVKYLKFNSNPIQIIPNNVLSKMPSIERFMCSFNGGQLGRIESFAFNSSSLKKLVFSYNNFNFIFSSFDSENIFKYCPNLEYLKLSGNSVDISNDRFIKMVRPLKNLKQLLLHKAGLRTFPSKTFGLMPNLEELVLSYNNVPTWSSDVFVNMTSLKTLDLKKNGIRLINSTSFPEEFLGSVSMLILHTNPFSCTCDLKWFRDWIRNNNRTLLSWPKKYMCASPSNMQTKLLESFNPTIKECAGILQNNSLVGILGAVTCVIVVSILLTALVVYKARWHIRYWIYLVRSKSSQYQQANTNDNYTFDGFVIYCDEDRIWVHEQLLPVLEKDENLRLCIHFRDFDVGKLIVDNIVDSILSSRKVIVVLSNNFVKSEWCQFELRLVLSKFLNGGSDIMVLVMLHEIDSKSMSSSLRTLITSTTYSVWSEQHAGNKLFWDQLKLSLKR